MKSRSNETELIQSQCLSNRLKDFNLGFNLEETMTHLWAVALVDDFEE